ncbi:E3 ubiquitin ligase BIG BROTHER-related [Diplonema papillatum]|nr:E3 ubiquitin ligase BIG BROTHER-related [Diplonema papillatum]
MSTAHASDARLARHLQEVEYMEQRRAQRDAAQHRMLRQQNQRPGRQSPRGTHEQHRQQQQPQQHHRTPRPSSVPRAVGSSAGPRVIMLGGTGDRVSSDIARTLAAALAGFPQAAHLHNQHRNGSGSRGGGAAGSAPRELAMPPMLAQLLIPALMQGGIQVRQHQPRPGHGADQRQIDGQCGRFVLRNKEQLTEENERCNVCLADYENGEELRVLPCMHLFHPECVDRWLRDNAVCPTCRADIAGMGREAANLVRPSPSSASPRLRR